MDEVKQDWLRVWAGSDTVINVPLEQLWHGACERLLYEVLKVALEQTRVAGTHLGAHGHPTLMWLKTCPSKWNVFKVRTSSARRPRVAVGGWRDSGGRLSRKTDRALSPSAWGREVYSDTTAMVKRSCGWKCCAVFMCLPVVFCWTNLSSHPHRLVLCGSRQTRLQSVSWRYFDDLIHCAIWKVTPVVKPLMLIKTDMRSCWRLPSSSVWPRSGTCRRNNRLSFSSFMKRSLRCCCCCTSDHDRLVCRK